MVPAAEVWHGNRFARCGVCDRQWALREELSGLSMQCPSCGTVVIENALFGHYQAVRRIDAGGLGEVIEAIDGVTGRSVAIKTLRHVLFQNPAFVAQFAREATIIGNLAHPNIAEVYEFFEDRGIHLLAMEFLENGSLMARIRDSGPVPEGDLLRIAMDVVRGLAAALAKRVLHRDIKPANILFDAHGRAKVVDFGLALPVSEAHAATGGNWGSPYYVPPERIEGQPEDFRGDIYSLGVTLFHAATGRTPFHVTSASAMAWKHLKAQHVSVKTFARHLSEPTANLINRCMERRPEDRFHTYFELLDALEAAQKELVFAPPTPIASPPDLVGATEEYSSTLRWLGIVAAAMLLAGGTIFALKARSRGPDFDGTLGAPATSQTADSADFEFGEAEHAIASNSFENGLVSWTTSGDEGMSVVVTDAAWSGSYGLRVTDTSGTLGSSVVSANFPAQPGWTYQLRYWARQISGNGMRTFIEFYNTSDVKIDETSKQLPNVADWREYALRATAPSDAATVRARLRSYNASIVTADFDELVLSEVLPRPRPAVPSMSAWQRNPVFPFSNPGFESDFASWDLTGDGGMTEVVTDPAGAHGGSKYMRVTDNSGGGSSALSEPFSVQPGKTYRVSAWAKTVSGIGAGLYIYFFNTSGDAIAKNHVLVPTSATNWTPVSVSAIAPVDAVTSRAKVHSYNTNTVIAEFDDFEFKRE